MNPIGQKIKEIRKDKEITQEYVALKLGKQREWVIDLEGGLKDPTISVLNKLADILECSVDDFLIIKDGHLQVVTQSSHIGYHYHNNVPSDNKQVNMDLLIEKDKRIEEKDVTIKLLISENEYLKAELSKIRG